MFFAFPLPHLFPVACTVSSDSNDTLNTSSLSLSLFFGAVPPTVILSSLTSRQYVLAPLRHHVCTTDKCLPQFDCLRHRSYTHSGSFPEFVESVRLSPTCSRVLSTITRVNSYILPFPSRHCRFLEPALVNFDSDSSHEFAVCYRAVRCSVPFSVLYVYHLVFTYPKSPTRFDGPHLVRFYRIHFIR